MKRFASFLLLFAAIFALSATRADAGNYPTRIIGYCSVSHQPIYAYYRPISYHGTVRYAWVPAYHTNRVLHPSVVLQRTTVIPHPRVISPRVVVPHSRSVCPSSAYYYRPSVYSGYLSPGFSITIRR